MNEKLSKTTETAKTTNSTRSAKHLDSVFATVQLGVAGMTCIGCEQRIKRALTVLPGICETNASWNRQQVVVGFDESKITVNDIKAAIRALDYEIADVQAIDKDSKNAPGSASNKELNRDPKKTSKPLRTIAILLTILVLYLLLDFSGLLNVLVPSKLADFSMSYMMIFVIGLITSVHCLAMCGGINISQSLVREANVGLHADNKQAWYKLLAPVFLYNFGRLISYTVLGFILGLIGYLLVGASSAFLVPAFLQGILKLLAGAIMIIMGLNMLGIFPALRKLTPRLPAILSTRLPAILPSLLSGLSNNLSHASKDSSKNNDRNKSGGKSESRSKGNDRENVRVSDKDNVRDNVGYNGRKSHVRSFVVGLLNGLMPCGPMQSMQIVALASANPINGALAMLLFSMGTLPAMLGLGSFISLLGKRFRRSVLLVGAILVVALGLVMLGQGGILSGLLSPNLLLMLTVLLVVVGIIVQIPFWSTYVKALVSATATTAVLMLVMCGSMLPSVGDFFANAGFNAAANNTVSSVANNTSSIASNTASDAAIIAGTDARLDVDGNQVVNSTLSPGTYPHITVLAGTPVKWVIDAPQGSVNGCNNRIIIRDYAIEYSFEVGQNVLSFVPVSPGIINYSCWMGMIRGTITVI